MTPTQGLTRTAVVCCMALAVLIAVAVTLTPWLLVPLSVLMLVLAIVLLPLTFWVYIFLISMFLSFGVSLVPPVSIGGLDIRLYDLCLTGFALKGLLHVRSMDWNRVKPLVLATILYGLSQVLSLVLAAANGYGYTLTGAVALVRLLMQLVACILIAALPSTGLHVKAARAVEQLGLIWCASVVGQWLLATAGTPLGNIYGDRFTGFFGDPAQSSVVACLFFFVGLARRTTSTGGWVSIAVSVLAFILSGTRGSLPVLALGTLILIWLKPRMTRKTGRSVSLALLGGLVVLLSLQVGPLAARVTEASLSTSLFMRADPIVRTWRIFAAHPVFGVGYTGSSTWYPLYSDGLRYEQSGTYNQWVQIGAESGTLGLFSFLVLVWVAVRIMRIIAVHHEGTTHDHPFVYGAVAYVLSVNLGYLTETWWQPGSMISHLLWVVLGLVVGMRSCGVLSRGGEPTSGALKPIRNGPEALIGR